MTAEEFSKLCGVSKSTVNQWCKRGFLDAEKTRTNHGCPWEICDRDAMRFKAEWDANGGRASFRVTPPHHERWLEMFNTGYSRREIAEATDSTYGAVQKFLARHRARKGK
jgi:DNA-directed RNA polymerase specialized sigma24 family protein